MPSQPAPEPLRDPTHVPVKRRRGFAAMNPSQLRRISSLGGRTAQAVGYAHKFTAEESRAGGRKGGLSVSQNRAHMAAIGRRGGQH